MIINFDKRGSGGGSDPALAASAFTGVDYISSGNVIYFYNKNGYEVGSIDTSDFVIDGMVEDVYLSGTTLVIDFNTESGQQDIEVDLSDIFHPENYYTSAQTDTLISNAKTEVYASGTSYADAAILAAKNDVYASGVSYTNAAIAEIDLSSAVASAKTYTDGQVSALTAHLEDVEQVTASAYTDLNTRVVALSAASENFITSSDIANFVTSGQVETQITGKNYVTSGDVETQITDKNYVTSGQVETQITSKNYITSSAISHMVESADDSVINVIKISQADYDALVAQSATSITTLYIIA